jgi:hypothetical protein
MSESVPRPEPSHDILNHDFYIPFVPPLTWLDYPWPLFAVLILIIILIVIAGSSSLHVSTYPRRRKSTFEFGPHSVL